MSSVLKFRVRSGAYHDSIVLMRLQSALAALEGVEDAGAVMATDTNLSLLRANGLLPDPAPEARPEDLLVAVRGESEDAAEQALEQIDALLAHRSEQGDGSWRPRSLRGAQRLKPDARWVLISVPGRYAAEVAREALHKGRNVFLYSDNVSLEDERRLKETARERGLLVLGPDCGTAMLGGTGLGFANRVRRGAVGLIAASGTGLQSVTCRIHELGSGVSHGIGTGGRDLSDEIGAITTLQALRLLADDAWTRVIALVSKPPSPEVAGRILRAAGAVKKPVVVGFLGYPAPGRRLGNLHFARDLEEVAEISVELANDTAEPANDTAAPAATADTASSQGQYLRGLFSGGTLAYEALLSLKAVLQPMASNLHAPGVEPLDDPTQSRGHTIVDLGDDALTVGRLHPMMDPDAGRRRLLQEAADPQTAVILMDVVLGDGAHAEPAAELADTIREVTAKGKRLVLCVIGTDEDPQDLERQMEALREAGAEVTRSLRRAVDLCLELLPSAAPELEGPAVDAADLEGPIEAWNVGLESLYQSLVDQGSDALHVEWRPPAGGNETLAAILRKMKAHP